ncbi:MAG: metallophosphoesterase [Bacteroidota bacterium]
MNKLLNSLLFVLLSSILVLTLRAIFPKNAGILRYFFFFLLFDAYLWFSIRKRIKLWVPALRNIAFFIYWLPLSLILMLMVYGFFISFLDWNVALRTYSQSFILVLFLSKIFPILALILSDILRLGKFTFSLFHPDKGVLKHTISRYKPLLLTGWILGAIVFLIMLAGTVFWQSDFRVRKQIIKLKELPKEFDGFKIVQFSDVHLGTWASKQKLSEAMDIINGLNPDVIFSTGDMFNYSTADGKGFENILKKLHAPYGIYTIMGNHDYGDYLNWPSMQAKHKNIVDLSAYYKNLGWRLLLNSNDILKKGNDSIAVVGVENWGATHRFQRAGDIAKAQKGTENIAVQLLLSHDPSHWDSIISKKFTNIDLTFSGHTHGGQIGIDCCNVHWSPVAWTYKHWCGFYENNHSTQPQYIYVNQALGNIGYSGRIGILPEITLVILKRD